MILTLKYESLRPLDVITWTKSYPKSKFWKTAKVTTGCAAYLGQLGENNDAWLVTRPMTRISSLPGELEVADSAFVYRPRTKMKGQTQQKDIIKKALNMSARVNDDRSDFEKVKELWSIGVVINELERCHSFGDSLRKNLVESIASQTK